VRATRRLEKLFNNIMPSIKTLIKSLKLAGKHRELTSEKVITYFIESFLGKIAI
jgi:hypothetical protein